MSFCTSNTKRYLTTALLIMTMLSCLSTALAGASDVITIGLSLGLSGKYERSSTVQRNGFRLWETKVNEKGGILGRKVRLHLHDDKSDPLVARQLYKNMIEEQKVDFIFAPFSSAITEAILPIAEKNGYPVIASGASADRLWQQGYTNIFGLFTPASKIAVSFLEMAAMKKIKTSKGWYKVFFLIFTRVIPPDLVQISIGSFPFRLFLNRH